MINNKTYDTCCYRVWHIRVLVVLAGLILFPAVAGADADQPDTPAITDITLAATDWCPYSCADKNGPAGIVTDYLSAIFATRQVKLVVKTYPWSRAVALARTGDGVDGLLTAVPGEAQGLILTDTPTTTYQDCFFTRQDDDWQFTSTQSLQDNDRILGVIAGYGYDERVMAHIDDPAWQYRVYTMSGEDAQWRLMQQLQAGRVDILIEDPAILNWTRRQKHPHAATKGIRKTSCLAANPFFVAINPNLPGARDMIDWLNHDLALAENHQMLSSIMASYLGKVR